MAEESAPPPSTDSKGTLVTPFHVWLVFLVIGGGLLAVYYQKISYLPDIEWRDTLIYLAVVSFIGLAYGLLEALAIFLPGFIWAEELVCDDKLRAVFCLVDNDKYELCVSKIAKLLGVPFAFCLIVSHVALFAGEKWYLLTSLALILLSPGYVWLRFVRFPPPMTTLGLVKEVIKLIKRILDKNGSGNVIAGSAVFKKRFGKYSAWFGLSIALNLLAVFLIFCLVGWKLERKYIYLSAVCIGTVLASNHIVAARWNQNRRTAIIASVAATLLLLVVADGYTSLTEKIMGRYGMGSDHHYNLVVTKEGAELINALGLPTCGSAAPNKLCDVEMLSGIGQDYYLKQGERRFTIPKTMVVARVTTP